MIISNKRDWFNFVKEHPVKLHNAMVAPFGDKVLRIRQWDPCKVYIVYEFEYPFEAMMYEYGLMISPAPDSELYWFKREVE